MNPVFVVGVFRSGTSLLYSLLNQHPQMAFMYECDALNFPELLCGPRFRGNWLERQEFYNQALSRHRLIYGNSLRGLESVRTPEDLYEVYGQGKDAILWGEKSPFYCSHLERLAKRNPQSPFVLIWRDPIEVYRSVLNAGRCTRFFRRPGMLSRLIVYQEKMVAQAAALEKAGRRVHHVTYSDLIDKTPEVCEGICKFLGVPFDPNMLDLSSADLSAVYYAAQHDHLRKGVIQRQQISNQLIHSKITRKLERFRTRWTRLSPGKFDAAKSAENPKEPSFFERVRHQVAGNLLCAWDDTKRVLFEFMPLDWLRTYRGAAGWFWAARDGRADPNHSWREQIAAHWMTILVSYLLIAVLGKIDALDPHFSLLPFYMLPCAALALTINWRWGTVAAVITACIGPALLRKIDTSFAQTEVILWNSAMRFLLLEFGVVVLDRIRREFASRKSDRIDLHNELPLSETKVDSL
jgi:sulfotransferase family protein